MENNIEIKVNYLPKSEEIEHYFEFKKRLESGDKEPALGYALCYLTTMIEKIENVYKEMSMEESLVGKKRDLYNEIYECLKLYYTKEADFITDEDLVSYITSMRGWDSIPPHFQIRLEVFERILKEKGIGGY